MTLSGLPFPAICSLPTLPIRYHLEVSVPCPTFNPEHDSILASQFGPAWHKKSHPSIRRMASAIIYSALIKRSVNNDRMQLR
jgi:hypothetical protein